MGTRGLVGLYHKGITKAAYNQFDSYPSELGVTILKEIRDAVLQGVDLKAIFESIVLVDERAIPTPEEVEATEFYHDLTVSNRATSDWYCLLRKAQGTLFPYLDGRLKYMIDYADFIKNSLFCEWAYLINLDTEMFEVWRGYQQKPVKGNRYGVQFDENTKTSIGERYFPCRMVKEYRLAELPTNDDFLKETAVFSENP